ncbi:NEQ379 [Nanoarchaeum equitans Kin4-M]|uniref:Large ribosomal subunit protein eL19 n=1 Tax=Nanoarchaeum equitans (strain Kin4-M) TaxID=228908 RepID=Q74N10_NANEQ|nr:NEQ379 [Nanoarchaeum equitans Kin4-M]
MDVSTQRRMAAEILKVGLDRVWIDPNHLKEVAEALTKDDIRELIKRGIIKKLPIEGQSRKRARELHEKKKKGRRRGPGSRKGKRTARADPKRQWINKVRAQRKLLKELKEKKIIDNKTYWDLYKKVKGNLFKSRSHLLLYLKQKGIM